MDDAYLEVTYRNGRPFIAYLHLPRKAGDKSVRQVPREGDMVIDIAADGRPIGIEFISPSRASLGIVNEVLALAGQSPATDEDLAPLGISDAESSKQDASGAVVAPPQKRAG